MSSTSATTSLIKSAKIMRATWFFTSRTSPRMSSQEASSLHISSSSRASMPSSMFTRRFSSSLSAMPAPLSASPSPGSCREPKRTASPSLVRTFSQVCCGEVALPSSTCFSRKRDSGGSPKPGRRQPSMRGPVSLTSSPAISSKASPSSRVKLSTSRSRTPDKVAAPLGLPGSTTASGLSSSSSSDSSSSSSSSSSSALSAGGFLASRRPVKTPSRFCIISSTAGNHSSIGLMVPDTVEDSSATPNCWKAVARNGPSTASEVSMPWAA
mmetsp:Transcript_1027/g.1634  ORF Transcript_1027/g.1634 Transcript_1027/m.1634 type:complete len:268 (-) Transcript_1027:595-1398(-)